MVLEFVLTILQRGESGRAAASENESNEMETKEFEKVDEKRVCEGTGLEPCRPSLKHRVKILVHHCRKSALPQFAGRIPLSVQIRPAACFLGHVMIIELIRSAVRLYCSARGLQQMLTRLAET